MLLTLTPTSTWLNVLHLAQTIESEITLLSNMQKHSERERERERDGGMCDIKQMHCDFNHLMALAHKR